MDQNSGSVIQLNQAFPDHVFLHHVNCNIQLILRFESVFYNLIEEFEIIFHQVTDYCNEQLYMTRENYYTKSSEEFQCLSGENQGE